MVESLPADAGDTGSCPGPGRSHMPRSSWVCEPWPLSLHIRSLCSAMGEATTVRGPRTTKKIKPKKTGQLRSYHLYSPGLPASYFFYHHKCIIADIFHYHMLHALSQTILLEVSVPRLKKSQGSRWLLHKTERVAGRPIRPSQI